MTRTGLFGGSFNPIHNGHIALARQLMQAVALDEVWFMVSPQNPLKRSCDLLDDDTRLLLARMALADEENMVASDYEFHLPCPSYTWNTLRHLAADYPDRAFTLLIGGDNWEHFSQWRNAADIINSCPIVVYPRPRHPIDASCLPQTVTVVNTPLIDISSTDIRRRIKAGQSIHALVPEAVERYIQEKGLYKTVDE